MNRKFYVSQATRDIAHKALEASKNEPKEQGLEAINQVAQALQSFVENQTKVKSESEAVVASLMQEPIGGTNSLPSLGK